MLLNVFQMLNGLRMCFHRCPFQSVLIQYAGFYLGNPMSSYILLNCGFLLFHRHIYMLVDRLNLTLGIEYIEIYIFYFNALFFIYLLPILAYEFTKYQRGCDIWQVTAKIAQLCIFLTKSHECMVNCAISSRNFSNHYMILENHWKACAMVFPKLTICF